MIKEIICLRGIFTFKSKDLPFICCGGVDQLNWVVTGSHLALIVAGLDKVGGENSKSSDFIRSLHSLLVNRRWNKLTHRLSFTSIEFLKSRSNAQKQWCWCWISFSYEGERDKVHGIVLSKSNVRSYSMKLLQWCWMKIVKSRVDEWISDRFAISHYDSGHHHHIHLVNFTLCGLTYYVYSPIKEEEGKVSF